MIKKIKVPAKRISLELFIGIAIGMLIGESVLFSDIINWASDMNWQEAKDILKSVGYVAGAIVAIYELIRRIFLNPYML